MKAKAKTAALVAAAVLGTAGAAWAVPIVSNVNMQQMGVTRKVQITYNLTGEDAIVTLSIETNGVAISDSAVTRLSGDVCKEVTQGTGKSILWDAGVDWPENVVTNAKARVTAWSIDAPPQVMVVDLTGGPAASTYPIAYYTSVEALPYGGLDNAIYKSAYLVMRKIANGAFNMGEDVCVITLTKDFYASVFQVTQGQWSLVMGSNPSYYSEVSSRLYRPVENVSYNNIRGAEWDGGGDWPANNNVYADSFLGRLRAKTGSLVFDLPTEAQWEYACRAGTTTYYNDGLADPVNTTSNPQMDGLGRYMYNGGYLEDGVTPPLPGCGPANGTAIVGSYTPNNWGLYDMHGNVAEWCLDWYSETLVTATDPKGANSETRRMLRGGSWGHEARDCRSAARNNNIPNFAYIVFGFRLVRNLP